MRPEQVTRHLRRRGELLRLQPWELVLAEPADLGGPLAEVHYDYDYLTATLETDRTLPLRTRQEQQETLTHELLHLVLAPVMQAAEAAVEALRKHNAQAADVYAEQLAQREEQVTETLARAIEEACR